MRFRNFGLLMVAAMSLALPAFSAPKAAANGQRAMKFDIKPLWQHKKADQSVGDVYFKTKGSMWGVGAGLHTMAADDWYLGFLGQWATGKLKSHVKITDELSDKLRNDAWDVMARFGWHFSLGQHEVNVGITPFIGVGYDSWQIKTTSALEAQTAYTTLKYRKGVVQIGFLSNYAMNRDWTLGVNAGVGTSFSARARDAGADFNVKLKNRIVGFVEVPIGYEVESAGDMPWGMKLVPFYRANDYGRDNTTSVVDDQNVVRMKNKDYGLNLEFYWFF